jgi:nucleoside-diphosphate-sugar epimerase
MAKKVLVTGASGFTGGHLCRHLVAKGYDVRAFVRSTSNIDALKKLGLEIVFGDVTDSGSLDKTARGIETVYHIAALYRQENIPKKLFWDVNVNGTKNILEASLKSGVQRFVHCSTVGVQGEITNPPAKEAHPYNPGDEYQRTKMEAEKLALRFFKENELPGVIVRPVGMYGPGDTRFLKLFKHIKNGKFIMFGSGKVLYHLTYIDDLVHGFELCGEKREALGQIYNICGDEYVTLDQLVAIIAQALGVPVPRLRLPFWPLWIAAFFCESVCKPLGIEPPIYRRRVDFFRKDRAFDISKAKKELGYEPMVDLKTGIKITADWYRENGYL